MPDSLSKHHGVRMRKIPTALALGELRWEYVQGVPSLGGGAAAFACRFAALGHATQIATRIGGDQLGERATELFQSLGVDVSLIQRDAVGMTSRVEGFLSADGAFSYLDTFSEKPLEVEVTPDLLGNSEIADILYMNSTAQGGLVSGATLRAVVERTGPSFKIYDIDCSQRAPNREQLEEGLSIASVVHTRGDELPMLCDLLGLPNLEPGLFAPAITERFGASYCVVADPFAGALISSVAGELVGLDRVRESAVDSRGWHEAFLAALAHHVFQGSSLVRCCEAGMRYGDTVAVSSGAVGAALAEDVDAVKAGDA